MTGSTESSLFHSTDLILGSKSRRAFLQGMGAVLFSGPAWAYAVPGSARAAAARAGKKVNLLSCGSSRPFDWGWQFTSGASVLPGAGSAGRPSIRVESNSGDYARYLVLGPEAGKDYTLSGWMKVDAIVPEEESAGAYFAASQFEFQGRPTEYTVDGKQLPEHRYENRTGTAGWRRFTQTFTSLSSTTWFELVVGIYRAAGTAWFSDLTFVEGREPAAIEETIDLWQALQWAHLESSKDALRSRPAAAILDEVLPVRGAASDPKRLGQLLEDSYDVAYLSADQLADPRQLCRSRFDLLVLPYGESFPLPARDVVLNFLADGGDLLSAGGYAFQSPLIRKNGDWEFYDESVDKEQGPNLLPPMDIEGGAWKAVGPEFAHIINADLPDQASVRAVRIQIPEEFRNRTASWSFDLSAQGDGKQFFFRGWLRTEGVQAASQGNAYLSVRQLDENGGEAYSASLVLEEAHSSKDWHIVERLITLIPTTRTLRISFGLKEAVGTVWGADFRLEKRSPQIRINTALGFPQDELQIDPRQIGMFDADYRIKRAATMRAADKQSILAASTEQQGVVEGYAATCVVGMNQARWIPLLETYDALDRKRGAAGSLVHHVRGVFARSSWSFFGVDSQDIFAVGKPAGEAALKAAARALARKCFLHGSETEFAAYRDGEPVRVRVLASNFGHCELALTLRWSIASTDCRKEIFRQSHELQLAPGQTLPAECLWKPAMFPRERYCVTAKLYLNGEEIDQIETGFAIWKQETLQKGMPFTFKENYFCVGGKNLFLQGTDDYLHTFIDQDENPLTWHADAQGCRDAGIDVYENLVGLRGPQQRPTETWWRWIDAMLLNVQSAGGIFFPGMLIFSNTAVSDRDLADQKAYVRAFAARYKEAAGIIYYLNGDLELHDPNLPNLQRLYRQFLKDKYGSDDALRRAWKLTPPEAPIDQLSIRRGSDDWRDVRTYDDFEFRTLVVRRWLNTMHDSIREEDTKHPVTAEFYQTPVSGIDLLSALGKLELANFGYFNTPEEDYYRFPQVCKFLDQSVRGKGINVGEFGVKTHPAWRACSEYISARSEEYEHALFLALAHYGFALGVSKIQNWCWKYPADLPFEWGINYPNELVPRDVLAYYRNSGLMLRSLRPRFECSSTVVLLASENRKGGQGERVVEGETNAIRLLMDARLRFHTLSDEFIESLPDHVKTIFYPLSYCPSDAVVALLEKFVEQGGQLYLSGDISYDALRQRTRTSRLRALCGVEFVAERFPNIAFEGKTVKTHPRDSAWPEYMASPGIIVRLAGASCLLETADGAPLVTEFSLGKGKVIFSADPVELHGDPRFQSYAHAFYRALIDRLHLPCETVEPASAPVHRFSVPSQDDRLIDVLVNYDTQHEVRGLALRAADRKIELSLAARMPGIVVSSPDRGVLAVESSADVSVDGELLVGCDIHLMAISLSEQPLAFASQWLLLPMGQGSIAIPKASRWHRPVLLSGELADGKWRSLARKTLETRNGQLRIEVDAGCALSLLIVCEDGEQERSVQAVESLAYSPWQRP